MDEVIFMEIKLMFYMGFLLLLNFKGDYIVLEIICGNVCIFNSVCLMFIY